MTPDDFTDAERRAYRKYENAMHAAQRSMWLLRARARRREGIVPPRADGWKRGYIGQGITVHSDGEEILMLTRHDYQQDEIYIQAPALAALVTFARRCGL